MIHHRDTESTEGRNTQHDGLAGLDTAGTCLLALRATLRELDPNRLQRWFTSGPLSSQPEVYHPSILRISIVMSIRQSLAVS
jgi:hypothetical protein